MLIIKEKLQKLLYKADNYREVLKLLGIPYDPNSLRKIYYYTKKWKLDSSGMQHQCFKKGHTPHNKIPLKNILTKNSIYRGSTSHLRHRLIKEGYFKHKCYNCRNTEWLGNKIPVQLEHINGIKTDYRISNLTLLCPNCHTFTSTFCGRNTQVYKKKRIAATIQKKERLIHQKEKNKNKELLQQKILKYKKFIQHKKLKNKKIMIKNRLAFLDVVNIKKYGWVQRLAKKWGVSHTQVRRFIKKYKPELYKVAKQKNKNFFMI